MVIIIYDKDFQRSLEKRKDNIFREQVKKQIKRIIQNPEIGKPIMYSRKGTREVYIGHFRLSYKYHYEKDTIEFLEVYHKDEQ
ncbi:type II toxin-antitoxin system RelE/ParE family toxin [Candidatus Pacearchaeota archaeon]|nr:type II toxin-antitoxin system RelE/ParE family toxin [Candidatus Pacearchaeota archaeon]